MIRLDRHYENAEGRTNHIQLTLSSDVVESRRQIDSIENASRSHEIVSDHISEALTCIAAFLGRGEKLPTRRELLAERDALVKQVAFLKEACTALEDRRRARKEEGPDEK